MRDSRRRPLAEMVFGGTATGHTHFAVHIRYNPPALAHHGAIVARPPRAVQRTMVRG